VIGAGLWLLTGAVTRPVKPDAATAPPAAVPDALATEAVEQALAALAPDRLSWLETGIWQKVRLPGFTYEADGRYLMGPDQCFRLEVQTRQGKAAGALLMVSDGDSLWQATRLGAGAWSEVRHLNLRQVFEALDGPTGSPELRGEFLQGPTFSGVAPLLRNLRGRLVWVKREVRVEGNADRLRLTGTWQPDLAATLAPADKPWPPGLPRQCRLTLDARNHWPRRVEWWGPFERDAPDSLLAEMEFRDPSFNRPLSPQRCEQEFIFRPEPGTAVSEETGPVTARLTARGRQAQK
jgi:hypothetical protein